MSRLRLKKLIGKRCTFEGDVHCATDSSNYMLLNITHNGKLVADHIWISVSNEAISPEGRISFTGTPYTYTDSKGERKTGIRKVFNIGNAMNDEMKHFMKNHKKRIARQ